jgi:hypothetical protein
MKKHLRGKTSVLVGVALGGLAALPAHAQGNDNLNRFRLSYRPGFNIKASFKELTTISPAIAGIDHNYVDGYNRVDNTGNRQNYTWDWGIQNANQAPGDGYIYMHNMDAGSVDDRTDDPQHGGELTYDRQLGTWGKAKWGIEAAANYTAIDISDPWAGNVSLVTDAYQFPLTYPWLGTGGRVSPEHIPYNGTYYPKYGNDTPLLSDVPNRSYSQANVNARRTISADLYGFRLGPYIEYPLNDRWSVAMSGGLAIGYIDSEFSFVESVANPEILRQGNTSDTDILVGGFVGVDISYSFNQNWSAFVGAQYQNLGTFEQTANNKRSELDLGTSLYATIGFGYSF